MKRLKLKWLLKIRRAFMRLVYRKIIGIVPPWEEYNRIYVCAGSKREFDGLCGIMEYKSKNIVYIHDPKQLRGLSGGVLLLYGSFRGRRDTGEIISIAQHRQIRCINWEQIIEEFYCKALFYSR